MFKKILLTIFLFNTIFFASVFKAEAWRQCDSLWPTDYNTFKEYCYKITDSYLSLRNKFKVDGKIDAYIAQRILDYSKQWLNYLPDDLNNKNYFTHLQTAIERWIKDPNNSANFDSIDTAIDGFLNKTSIQEITWTVEAFPATWNAPLTVTLRWNVTDPTWSKIENYNYTWWILDKWRRRNIWNNTSLNYTFREEWNYSIFLDVTSNHRNSFRNIDVIPFSKKVEISVKEKVASLNIKINNKTLGSDDEIKFAPEESVYWLLFDATSSIPTSWTKFIRTEWDFWNWITRKYDSGPKVERIVYATEWEYPVTLKLTTNEWKTIERKFTILIRNPIATINASSLDWFLWDKFTFTANSYSKNENLSYFWEILDLKNDKVIFSKNLSTLAYTFTEKGRYNVKLSVTSPSWQKDYDNKIIHINSRPPVAAFTATTPQKNKPNTVFLDASGSYDLDFSDDWKLEYSWIINWDRVELDKPNYNWSNWYYTFANIWEQSVVLEVRDPDDLVSQKTTKINIESNLSVDFFVFPRVSQVWSIVKFVADSPKAKFYEWDFWDGNVVWWKDDNISHKYDRAWTYTVKLSVRDENDLKNYYEKVIYVWDSDAPFAKINVSWNSLWENYWYEEWVCNGKWAYIVNKVDNVTLSWKESIDITWNNNWLDYTWKIWEKFYTTQEISRRFDDIWCVPIKLTVKSQKNWKESTDETFLKIQNLKPELTGLDVQVKDENADPVQVDVKILWAKDRDWVIQSYLWYYYTDVDPEPQDYRSTKSPNTTFVLPKIPWNYYFVAILKDNNWDSSSSRDLDSSKYFVTLSWENINTPIVWLSANNTSVKVWDEVIFKADVKNVLEQNISNDSKYSWDFDWDGFYDKETAKPEISYKFTKSWEFRVKVKVKHKWYTNSKSIIVNVSNILKPDFDYISIWNDVIIFDKSSGSIDSYTWDMWDGQTVDKKGSFIYTYTDWKSTHLVKLKITEWTNVRDTSKKVVRDFWKMISTKKEALAIFSDYAIIENKIILKNEVPKIQLYLKSNLTNIKSYGVDFDITNDSDLNWGKDDDEDNKSTPSYLTWWPIDVTLNWQKIQKIKIFLKDTSNKVIETRDLTIEKEFIKEDKNISTDEIVLDWVSESLKKTFERIKAEVSKLEWDNKHKALTYLQRLKDEWNDPIEKTSIIKEFASFIEDLKLANSAEISSMIEWLLVESEEDRSNKALLFNSLKNLIPKDVVCTETLAKEAEAKKQTCQAILIDKLKLISENSNLEENKALWKEILEVIEKDKTLTNEQKLDFRTWLKKLLQENLTKEEIDKSNKSTWRSTETWSSFDWWAVWTWFMWIAICIIGLIIAWVVYYKIRYRNEWEDWQSFTDYIAEKTWNTVSTEKDEFSPNKENTFDPLADEVNEKADSSWGWDVPDWLKGSQAEVWDVSKNDETEEAKIENSQVEVQKFEEPNDTDVPEWLKSPSEPVKIEKEEQKSFDDEFAEDDSSSENISENQAQPEQFDEFAESPQETDFNDVSELDDSVPDWLKWSLSRTSEEEQTKTEDSKNDENISENAETETNNLPEENIESEWEIPDWLKWSFGDSENKTEDETSNQTEQEDILWSFGLENEEPKTEGNKAKKEKPKRFKNKEKKANKQEVISNPNEPKLETEEELNEFTKIDFEEEPKVEEDNIPDWLKGSFWDDISKEKTKEKPEEPQILEQEEKKETDDFTTFESLWDKKETKKTAWKTKKTTKKDSKKEEKKSDDSSGKLNDDELWDDGMKIPDWLKTDSDK